MTRHELREIAFQFLYGNLPENGSEAIDFNSSDLDRFIETLDLKGFEDNDSFIWSLVEGVGKNLPTIDKAIGALSANWRLERMPRVDLTVMRLAAFELLFKPEIPKTVSINEAIELAKKFGAEGSSAFVNGLLDKLPKAN